MVNLVGLEAEILLKMAEGEPFTVTSRTSKEAQERLQEKGLTNKDGITDAGRTEAEWRSHIIEGVRDVYDLQPGGGYQRDIHFLYEPISPFSYAYNWCGLHGVSVIKTDPRKGTSFFEVQNTKFWLEGRSLAEEEITFNMPTSQIVEKWSKGATSMEPLRLWQANKAYFRFFLDLQEECFYDVLNLWAFQSWLITDESQFVSCFFIAIKGAYGGGKSVSCEALIFLGRHGKIANPSVAYLGRSIERLGFTVFMDEFDIIIETDPTMGRLARMCQRRGQSYDRATKSGIPQTFKVFGPWIMSVHGELEDALATRTIPITTEETSNPDVPIVNPEKMRIGQEIYDQMWMWYMDTLDYVSYESEKKRDFDFKLDTLVDELVVKFADEDTPYVTMGEKRSNFDRFDIHKETTQEYNNTSKSNVSNRANRSNGVKQHIQDLRQTVANSILASCTEEQKKIIRSAAGRNIELMVSAFKIANIIGVNCDKSIESAFKIKREVEEEEREVGLMGHLRDFLVDIYQKRREHENYWTKNRQFMVTNIECFSGFNMFLHRREQFAVEPGEYKRALRELGFIRPTSRKKMDVKTWKEIQEGETKKRVRLANIYSESVQRKIGLVTEMPDFGQTTLPEAIEEQRVISNSIADAGLQEKMEYIYGALSASQDGALVGELAERMGMPVAEVDKILALMGREKRVFSPRAEWWKIAP